MAAAYQLTGAASIFLRVADGALIPNDLGNADYQAFLAWQALGNTPDPIPTPAPLTIIDAAIYVGRFTSAELIAIHTFALTNPPIAASLATYQFMFLLGINRAIPLGGAGVTAIHAAWVTRGLLTQARSTAILTP